MRPRLALVLTVLMALFGGHLMGAPAQAARGSVQVTLDLTFRGDSEQKPTEFVLVTGPTINGPEQVHHAVNGVYTLPLRNDGIAFAWVRVVLPDGSLGPWVSNFGEGSRWLSWTAEPEYFEVSPSAPVVGPVTLWYWGIPDKPASPVAYVDTREEWAGVLNERYRRWTSRLVDLPPGSSTSVTFYGCQGDAPVATYTSHRAGNFALRVAMDRHELGPHGRAVITVRRPGLPDHTETHRTPSRLTCQPGINRVDNVTTFSPVGNWFVDEIDSHNQFPVWRRGQVNPLPQSAVVWRRTCLRKPRVGTYYFSEDCLRGWWLDNDAHGERLRIRVNGRTRRVQTAFRPRASWIGKRIKFTITVFQRPSALGYHWDGSVTRTFTTGKVLPAKKKRR